MSQKQKRQELGQLKELINAFNQFDLDKSGEISASELKKVLKSVGLQATDEEVQELMKSMDRDGDGSIRFYEFAKTMGSRFYAKNDVVALFQKFDKDNSGSITVDELYEVLKEINGPSVTKQDAKDLVAKVDKDGNGTINIAEFIRLMSDLDD